MSEYWISKKKYFCKYCDIYITDDVPSRTQHENGLRHQGNKERFVKGLYKAGEKRKKDEEEERREMRGVEAAAARAYALDVGAGRAGPSGAPTPVAPKPAAPPPKKPSNPYANYTTAEFLGYTDPDAERLQAELERKRTQGVVGDWETLPTTTRIPTPPISASDIDVDTKPSPNATNTISIGMKREAAVAAADADDEDGRAWKLRKKTATLGDIYDPGVIPIKIRTRTKAEEESVDVAAANTGGGDKIVSANEDTKQGENTTAAALKLEPTPVKLENTSSQTITSDTVGGSLFKKRKAPSGAGQGRRAQF